ncbi:hypothetical protein ABEV54_06520 [Peribacillus psychrosaccharolyticus]|uniref:hypothetical protein n=1 Tax=Peribacillus psychrosaccharolyticus TaxID=1407 RepID=UPI003D2A78B6
MTFSAKTHRGKLIFLLFINVLSMVLYFPSGILAYLQLSLVFLTLLLVFIHFTLRIDEGLITYQVLFLSLVIWKKELNPQQMKQLTFKRVGWSTQCAVIQTKHILNLQIIHFTPEDVFQELALFNQRNGIPINKSKDYSLLEKVEKGSG